MLGQIYAGRQPFNEIRLKRGVEKVRIQATNSSMISNLVLCKSRGIVAEVVLLWRLNCWGRTRTCAGGTKVPKPRRAIAFSARILRVLLGP